MVSDPEHGYHPTYRANTPNKPQSLSGWGQNVHVKMSTDSTRPGTSTDADSEPRTERALDEDMAILDAEVEGTHGIVHVSNGDSSKGGTSYNAVMINPHTLQSSGCSCEDKAYRNPDGGCKHERFADRLLKVIASLDEEEYVTDEEILGMLDVANKEAGRVLHLVRGLRE